MTSTRLYHFSSKQKWKESHLNENDKTTFRDTQSVKKGPCEKLKLEVGEGPKGPDWCRLTEPATARSENRPPDQNGQGSKKEAGGKCVCSNQNSSSGGR